MRSKIEMMSGWVAVVVLAAALCGSGTGEEMVRLSSLDLSKMRQGWGQPQVDRSVQGKPIMIGGQRFERGVGTHACSVLHIRLDGRTERLVAYVGVDDETSGKGTVRFKIYGDGRKLFDSGVMRGGQEPEAVDVELGGVRQLVLLASSAGDGIDYDHADWAEACFVVGGQRPAAVDGPVEKKVILTPAPPREPQIHGPKVYGARPGRPFLYRICCTGERPIRFSAEALPDSLVLDQERGIIRGRVPQEMGTYVVKLRAENSLGRCERQLQIVVGEKLALTPPMGWNHWYTFYDHVTAEDIRAAADAMIESGMADFGYQYVNIDDGWMIKPGAKDPMIGGEERDAAGAIRPNKRFGDIKALVDYIHSKGLKAGLYTSPGPLTCAGFTGSYGHEEIDARKFAEWGFDFLKYDWCSYGRVAKGKGLERAQRPYRKMGDILRKLDRDIVYNLCQYGMAEVWQWGCEVGGNCWRTTGDLGLARGGCLPGFYKIGMRNAQHFAYAQPGCWNDPDYILIGYVGNARRKDDPPAMTSLTPNEQYSYMSLWCLMAAPLFYSGDMTKLDAFTLNVLCNAEVIEVDQDPLGVQGRIVRQSDEELIMAKPLEDGSLAVGLFNFEEVAREVVVEWQQLGIDGPYVVRDLWRQKDIAVAEGRFPWRIGRHGVMLVRLRKSDKQHRQSDR